MTPDPSSDRAERVSEGDGASGAGGVGVGPTPRKSSRGKHFTWVAIVLLIALGGWLVYSPVKVPDRRPGAGAVELKLGRTKGMVEVWHPEGQGHAAGEPEFRVLLRNGYHSEPMSADEFRRVFGPQALSTAISTTSNWAFQLFNITSWWSLAWVAVGLVGQVIFSGRVLLQWLISEKHGESVVPPIFWWMSLGGGMMLFTYFVWRQDPVGVLGQAPGVVIYGRNLRMIYKARAEAARGGAAGSRGS